MFQTISVTELKEKLQQKNVQLIDVREPHERAEFNIGGIHLPLGKIQTMQIDDIEDLRNEELYVYCRSGVRSANACMILNQLGFTNVTNVQGGMLAWQEAKL
jgi:rhodanese-related sulfurtransferase